MNGSFCVGSWAGVTYLRCTVLMSLKKGETAVYFCDSALSVLVMLVSWNVFHEVSSLQSIVFVLFCLADQISCRSYVDSVYRIQSRPLQLFTHQRRKSLGTRLQRTESITLSKATLKSNQSFTGHQLHLSQLLSETVKKKGVCRLSVLGPSHFLQQGLGPSPHSEDVCQSTRTKQK